MNRTRKHRGGIAMILVVVVMAAAAIMGFALLSAASTQSQAGRNATSSVDAEGMVQTGTNLALYYLMYPEKADPSVLTRTTGVSFYNPGTSIPSLMLSNGSRVTRIDVSRNSDATFNVDVTATAGETGSTITRSTRNVVQVKSRYLPKYAMCSNASFSMPLTFLTSSVSGPVRCDGGYGGLTSILSGLLFGTTDNPTPTFPKLACPAYSDLNICKRLGNGTYSYGGATYNATRIGTSTITSTNLSNTAPASNPGNVYYVDQDTILSGTINFIGTLIVTNNKSLTINSSSVTITAKPGYPALIVSKDIIFTGGGKSLKVNGVCWVGGNLTGTGTLPSGTFTVNGSLMWGGTNPKIDTSLGKLTATSKLVVTYPTSSTIDAAVPDLCYVPELCDEDPTPQSVKILSRAALANTTATTN
jgi:hypothetical protein